MALLIGNQHNLFTVVDNGAGNRSGNPYFDRYTTIFSAIGTPVDTVFTKKGRELKARALWTEICAQKTQVFASSCGEWLLFTDNYCTSNELGLCLLEMTDDEMRLIGTIRLN